MKPTAWWIRAWRGSWTTCCAAWPPTARPRAPQVLKRDGVAGKTGTTNDSVDVWFSGYTPALTTTVWMGFDQPKSLDSSEFGAGLTLSAWLQYMQTALKGIPVAPKRPMPPNILTANGEYYLSNSPGRAGGVPGPAHGGPRATS